jgi:hypothetical protein
MLVTCGIHKNVEEYIKRLLSRKDWKERDLFEDPNVDGRVMLEFNVQEHGVRL